MHPFSVRDLEHALCGVLCGVQDDMVRAVRARDRCFLRCARRADHSSTACLDELREEQAEAARDGVHQDDLALFDLVRLFDKSQSGKACRGE